MDNPNAEETNYFKDVTNPSQLYNSIKQLKDEYCLSNFKITSLLRSWLESSKKSLDEMLTEHNETVLHKACFYNDLETVKILLEVYKDCPQKFWKLLSVNHTLQLHDQDRGSTAFDEAIKLSHTEIVNAFIQAADDDIWVLICSQNSQGDTPMHIAAFYGKTDTVEQIRSLAQSHETTKTYLAVKNWSGCTALHRAAYAGNLRICQILIKEIYQNYEYRSRNDIINTKDKNNHTAKDWAHCGLENECMRGISSERIFEYSEVIITLKNAMSGIFE